MYHFFFNKLIKFSIFIDKLEQPFAAFSPNLSLYMISMNFPSLVSNFHQINDVHSVHGQIVIIRHPEINFLKSSAELFELKIIVY